MSVTEIVFVLLMTRGADAYACDYAFVFGASPRCHCSLVQVAALIIPSCSGQFLIVFFSS